MFPSHHIRPLDVHAGDESLGETGGKPVLTDSGGYGYLHQELETNSWHEEECLSDMPIRIYLKLCERKAPYTCE